MSDTRLDLLIIGAGTAGLSAADASPMFGGDTNAGRGPDRIKFFTGIATAFKLTNVCK